MSVKQQSIESSINAAAMVGEKPAMGNIYDRMFMIGQKEDKGLRRLVEGRGREGPRGPLGVSPPPRCTRPVSLWTPSSSSR